MVKLGYARPSWRSDRLSNSLRNLEFTIERGFNTIWVPIGFPRHFSQTQKKGYIAVTL
jgi:hypothetical protein